MSKKSMSDYSDERVMREAEKRAEKKIIELSEKRAQIEKEMADISNRFLGKNINEEVIQKKKMNKVSKTMSRAKIVGDKSLKDRLIEISVDGEPRTVNDFLAVLKETGWTTSSTKPYNVVAAQLNNHTKMFRRVSKGTYQYIKN